MPNLALCAYALSNGRTCRQPRLRNDSHCRFHIRNNRVAEHDARIYQLNDELEAMDMPQLLETLLQRLENIYCELRCYPEAKFTLIVAIDRLKAINPKKSMRQPQPQQNQQRPSNSNNLQELLENLMQSMTYSR
jgi:hypothetical protein